MWPFDRLRRRRPPVPTTEAMEAQRTAEAELRRELRRGDEVDRVTNSIHKAVVRNHFSEAMERLIVRGEGNR